MGKKHDSCVFAALKLHKGTLCTALPERPVDYAIIIPEWERLQRNGHARVAAQRISHD
jgi:hypothetical protein